MAERPGEEFVLGIMGRFWTPTGGVVEADAEGLRRSMLRRIRTLSEREEET